MAETLLTRKWSDPDISEDLEYIKEALGTCMATLTYVFFKKSFLGRLMCMNLN
jgi:hypothetical protein